MLLSWFLIQALHLRPRVPWDLGPRTGITFVGGPWQLAVSKILTFADEALQQVPKVWKVGQFQHNHYLFPVADQLGRFQRLSRTEQGREYFLSFIIKQVTLSLLRIWN